MTPQEADVIRYLERRNGLPTSRDDILRQFIITDGYWQTISHSLKEKLLLEQDRQYYRLTVGADDALADFDDRWKYEPFKGKKKW